MSWNDNKETVYRITRFLAAKTALENANGDKNKDIRQREYDASLAALREWKEELKGKEDYSG